MKFFFNHAIYNFPIFTYLKKFINFIHYLKNPLRLVDLHQILTILLLFAKNRYIASRIFFNFLTDKI